jgi:hypothetical protein
LRGPSRGPSCFFQRVLDERFGFTHRQAARHHVTRQASLIGFAGERDDRPRVTHRELARGDVVADFLREFEQANIIRDGGAVLAHLGRNLFVSHLKFFREPLICRRGFNRIQILALDVFDQRHFEEFPLVASRNGFDHDGDFRQMGALRGAPAALAGDDLIALAPGGFGLDLVDDDRLNHAVGLNRARQLLEPGIVHGTARLIVIGLELVDVDVKRQARSGKRISGFGDEGAEALAKSRSFFHQAFLATSSCANEK